MFDRLYLTAQDVVKRWAAGAGLALPRGHGIGRRLDACEAVLDRLQLVTQLPLDVRQVLGGQSRRLGRGRHGIAQPLRLQG
jgi:hypothetical protein